MRATICGFCKIFYEQIRKFFHYNVAQWNFKNVKTDFWLIFTINKNKFSPFLDYMEELYFNIYFKSVYSKLYTYAILHPGFFKLYLNTTSFLTYTSTIRSRIRNQTSQHNIFINSMKIKILEEAEDLLNKSLNALQWLLAQSTTANSSQISTVTANTVINNYTTLLKESGKDLCLVKMKYFLIENKNSYYI